MDGFLGEDVAEGGTLDEGVRTTRAMGLREGHEVCSADCYARRRLREVSSLVSAFCVFLFVVPLNPASEQPCCFTPFAGRNCDSLTSTTITLH